MKEPAHVAYDAHCDALEWRDRTGIALPHWVALDETQRQAWRAAINAVLPEAD